MWEFKTGSGTVAYDTSGVEPALDLTLSGDVTWVGGWGINVRSGKAQGSTTSSKKLHDLIKATGEYTIEAWVAPGNVAQEESRIVSYSGGTMARNFMLGQTLYSYDFHNRSSSADQNGDPKLTTSADDEDLQATLQHVVATYDPVNGRRIYVNGEFTDDIDPVAGGTLGDWDDTFAFVLGNEVSGDRQFQGVFRLVAVYNRAITPAQITQNFQAGVGEKFYLLFSVSHLVDMPQAYIMFEVSQLDSYGYLFDKPTFISLDAGATPGSIPMAGIRIGVNGAEAAVGQAYRTLDTVVDDSNYGPGGQRLSDDRHRHRAREGSGGRRVLPDLRRARRPHQRAHGSGAALPAPPPDVPRPADIGLRVFDEINATMSELTGVSTQSAEVAATYEHGQAEPADDRDHRHLRVGAPGRRSRSSRSSTATRWSSDDGNARTTYFPGFNFTAAPATAFDAAGRRDRARRAGRPHGRSGVATDPVAGRGRAPSSTR